MYRFAPLALAALCALTACDRAPEPPAAEPEPAPERAAAPVDPHLDPDDPTMLRRPFTAEEIRDEWVEGLTLVLSQITPEGQELQRWRVVAADEEGADIEFAYLDPEGDVLGRPVVRRTSWAELRDHATFEAASATREETVRDTALGRLEGWRYRARDEESGTVTEMFFAHDLPGAPVWSKTTRDGEPVIELRQVERHRPV